MLNLSLLVLALLPGAAVRPAVPPAPPTSFRGPELVAEPLDRRMARDPVGTLTGAPGTWCPSGDEEFQRWLQSREASRGRPRALPKAGGLPNVTLNNEVVVIEDDGTLMRYDRRPDLEGVSLEWTPSGDGYTVVGVPSTYDPDAGRQVFVDQRGYAEEVIDISMMGFPFGGIPRTRFWVTSNFVVAFEDPSAPGPAQLHLPDLISDRLPRIAPLAQGSSMGGWNAFVKEAADRTLVTWRATDGGGYDVDVQLAMHADGRIGMTWQKLRGVSHGSVVIVDGDAAWWNDRADGGFVEVEAGNVLVPAPDGPAADLVAVRAFQVGGSEILQIELETLAPLPAATDGTIQYVVEIRDEPGGDVLSAVWFEWEDGRFNWQYAPAEMLPSGFRFNVNRTGLALTDDDINVTAWTATAWTWQEAVGADLAWPQAPPVPLMRDWSVSNRGELRGPLVEAFTLPELDVGAVHRQFAAQFDDPRIDGLAIYQNFLTDIVFFAGAYSTVGNAGADGVGAGNTTDPESPALLHMNTIRYGWNSWDEGKVTVLNHEYGHHWLYFYSILEGADVGKPCGDGHPAGWTHCPAAAPVYNSWDASCMGGSNWTDNADGTFTSTPGFASYGYSWHELYLMGLADVSEVPDWFYLRDSVPGLPGAYWPPDNSNVTATRVDVTVQQIVDAIGPRVPDASASRRDFTVPMVLVVRPGEWQQSDVDEVHRTCEVWRDKFNVATVGRGTVTCDRVGDRPPTVEILEPPTDVTVVKGTTLAIRGRGVDPDFDTVNLAWDFSGAGFPAAGEGPHDVTFTQSGTYVVTLDGSDATGRGAVPATRTVTVVCAVPDAVPILRVGHEGTSTLTFSADVPPVADEAVVGQALALPPTFLEVGSGALPLTLPQPSDRVVFYRLAGRNLPDCLGPW